MDVLIVGLRGLGVEIAKNLILAGPHAVVVHDNNKVTPADLGANFYLLEEDCATIPDTKDEKGKVVKKGRGPRTRSEASMRQLGTLNPNVAISAYTGAINTEYFKNFHVRTAHAHAPAPAPAPHTWRGARSESSPFTLHPSSSRTAGGMLHGPRASEGSAAVQRVLPLARHQIHRRAFGRSDGFSLRRLWPSASRRPSIHTALDSPAPSPSPSPSASPSPTSLRIPLTLRSLVLCVVVGLRCALCVVRCGCVLAVLRC
jgi:hypothetical protein